MGLENITINSEVWNKVVSGGLSWFFKRSREFALQFCFSLLNMILCINNIFIYSEIWYSKTGWLPCFFERM